MCRTTKLTRTPLTWLSPLGFTAVIRKPLECVSIVTTDSRAKLVVGFCVQYWCRTDMEWKSLKLRPKKVATQLRISEYLSDSIRQVSTNLDIEEDEESKVETLEDLFQKK
nr:MLO-related protein [Tanacetum cinerariifolium]